MPASATSAGSASGAEQDLASIELTRMVYRVRADVSQALARMQTARTRVVQTEDGLIQAIESADKNFIGLHQTARPAGELLRLVVRPQEVVAALIALEVAYEQYASAVNEYNAAQFELYRALGQPAQWVTSQPGHVALAAGDSRSLPAAARQRLHRPAPRVLERADTKFLSPTALGGACPPRLVGPRTGVIHSPGAGIESRDGPTISMITQHGIGSSSADGWKSRRE